MLNVGFVEIEVGGRRSVGLDDLVRYPLFAPDFIAFLRRVMPVEGSKAIRRVTSGG